MTETIKLIQKKVGVTADGIIGKKTVAAIAKALGIVTVVTDKGFPTQAQVRAGVSIFGKAGDESNLVNITPPYQLYYIGQPVKTIRVHRLIAKNVEAALKDVLKHYGAERIKQLGLDDYSGSYNNRNSTNGKTKSMHAWGIALDWMAAKNGYSVKSPTAVLSRTEYVKWWEIWEKHGAVSMGREYNKDWMHLQFAKFK